jgi:hypothetical protein
MSYEIAGRLDWRPIAICSACDILVIGVDHVRDQEVVISALGAATMKRFTPVFHAARIFLALITSLLVMALSQCPSETVFLTAVFTTPAFLWATPLDLQWIGRALKRFMWMNYGQEDSPGSGKPFIIKRVPGMKAIFDGIIRGYGLFLVVHSTFQLPWQSANNTPPWTIIETVIWSVVNRTCHCILTDVRDYDEDVKTGVPTIPVLLKSPFKTRMFLTAVQGAVMMAFLNNPFIVGNCCFTIALAWILGKDSPKIFFRLSLHSQSIFIIMYAAMSVLL